MWYLIITVKMCNISICSELQSTFHGIRQKFGEEREDLCFKLIRLEIL